VTRRHLHSGGRLAEQEHQRETDEEEHRGDPERVGEREHRRLEIHRSVEEAQGIELLVGVEGEDWEAVVLQTDPTFWKLIRARRKQSTISLTQLISRITDAAVSTKHVK